jgi:S-adenosylhomocysteine hydrolase
VRGLPCNIFSTRITQPRHCGSSTPVFAGGETLEEYWACTSLPCPPQGQGTEPHRRRGGDARSWFTGVTGHGKPSLLDEPPPQRPRESSYLLKYRQREDPTSGPVVKGMKGVSEETTPCASPIPDARKTTRSSFRHERERLGHEEQVRQLYGCRESLADASCGQRTSWLQAGGVCVRLRRCGKGLQSVHAGFGARSFSLRSTPSVPCMPRWKANNVVTVRMLARGEHLSHCTVNCRVIPPST